MKMISYLLALASIILLFSGCSAAPARVSVGPYWKDAVWKQDLVASININVLYPDKADAFFIVHSEGTVGFDYKDGKLVNPAIVKSTGYGFLDQTIIAGITATVPPPVDPAYKNHVYHFQLTIVMEPDPDQFRMILYSKIASGTKLASAQYPADRAVVDIHTDYIDGKLTNMTLHLVRGPAGIDKQVETALESLRLPSPPEYMVHKPVPLAITICVAQTYKACKPSSLVAWRSLHGLTFTIVPP